MTACKHIGNSSITVAECIALRDYMLVVKRKVF